MKIVLPVCGELEERDSRSLHAKMGRMRRMRKLLWLRHSHNVDVYMNSEPGVWLRSFHLLDTEAQYEDPVQEWGEEEEDGAVFGITLRREPVLPCSEVSESSSDSPSESPTTFSFIQYHTVKARRLKAATLERLVTHLLDPKHQESDFTSIFLSTYRAFTSTNTLIELLFQRDDSLTNLDNSVCPHSSLPSVIRQWLEEYGEDFHEPPQYQALRLLCAHLRHRLCFRRLAQAAETLLKTFQERDCSCSASTHSSKSLQELETRQEEQEEGGGGETSSMDEDNNSFMDFSVREIAEQLTRLDADLFVQVVPFHCLGCVWSQRDKKENRNLAPTVRATISQFNAVTNRVITSLLCPSSPNPSTSSPLSSPRSSTAFMYPATTPTLPRCPHASPAHRARIIERWIAVAQECREQKNFSSLKAILSALQSNAVYRLKKTWSAVCRESMATFDHLCETFPDENCVLATKEIPVENLSSGFVPYLGTYLTALTMLDTALTDNVEGGLINFEKRRREFEILSQIRQLQMSCSHYSFIESPQVTAWLQTHTLLTDQESYELSRDLEPPVDPCPSRLLSKKLASLRSSGDSPTRKTHSDQISVSSSGSSSSDMDELSAPQSSPLRLKLKSLSGSLHDVAEDFCSSSSSSSSSPSLCSSSSQPDLSSSSLGMSSDSSSSSPSSCSSSSSSSSCSSQASLPLYNKQIADSCIIRVSVESVSNGNIYKSILVTSQDHTPQVIQRALEKHNMEDVSYLDFSLFQMLSNGKELQIPDKANVYYAMCTTANFDFVLRQHWRIHRRHLGSPFSSGASAKGRHVKK